MSVETVVVSDSDWFMLASAADNILALEFDPSSVWEWTYGLNGEPGADEDGMSIQAEPYKDWLPHSDLYFRRVIPDFKDLKPNSAWYKVIKA